MNATEILERYLQDVEQNLPRRTRSDVRDELRSLLLDSAQERAAEAGRPLDADLMLAVVRGFGHPAEVALRYAGEQSHLIGPRSFPAYRLVTGIVVAAIVVGYTAYGLARSFTVFEILSGAAQMALLNFAVLTLVFAVLERIEAYQESRRTAPKVWEPSEAPPVKDPDALQAGSVAFTLYATMAAAWLMNFRLEWFPLLAESFRELLPMLNIFWAAAFVLNCWNLYHRRWTLESRLAELALGLYGLFIAYLVFQTRPFTPLGTAIIVPLLAIGMVIAVIEAVQRGVGIVQRLAARQAGGGLRARNGA